ncbi:MAG: tetratricopeptide repeat protein, partial [Spirochaetia bacterium]|nr:tetratricopeptide repeat protein [Spirochaetia bacterium]
MTENVQYPFMRVRVLTLGLAVFAVAAPAQLSALEHPDLIYAFTNYKRPEPMKMILVGEIRSKTKAPEVHEKESPVKGYDTRSDIVTIKVANREGLKPGQKLYVIEKNPFHRQHRDGLIVGEITVSSIFFSPFYGWALTGKGILLRVREGHFVARTLESENLERAFVLKRKGDHYHGTGDTEKAIQAYSDAIAADPMLPDAHAALGSLYFDQGRERGEYPVRALAEYEQAWKSRANFRYRLEEHRYYLDFMTALYGAYSVRRFEKGREANLVQLIDRIIEVGKAARDLSADSDTLL